MSRPPMSRLAGFAFGTAIALAILSIQLPPGRAAFAAVAVLLAIVGAILAASALRETRGTSGSDETRLLRDGLLGRAIVLDSYSTGRRRGEQTEIETVLDVQLPTRRRFEVTRRDWLTPAERDRVVVGRPVTIAADPDEPGHVVLVLDVPDVDERAIAALGPTAGGPGGARSDPSPRRGAEPVRTSEGEPAPDR